MMKFGKWVIIILKFSRNNRAGQDTLYFGPKFLGFSTGERIVATK
jgi:hypothetical protein